jgi:5-methylcytosine-specific restriction endonuclease McrA
MASATLAFKTLVCSHTQLDRDRMLHKLSEWFSSKQTPKERDISSILQELIQRNRWMPPVGFINDPTWNKLYSYDSCESFTQIVASKLVIPPVQHESKAEKPKAEKPKATSPKATSPKAEKPKAEKPKAEKPTASRKAIPKKIRGEAWANAFGDSMKGQCYCCKKELHAFDTWHAGHIVSHANGGKDIASNLRPTCTSCNLSMGTQNMDVFIQTYYNPNP